MTRYLFPGLLIVLALAGCAPERPRDAAARPPRPSAVAIAKGYVDPVQGVVRLAAPRDGLITQLLVEEGDHVAIGQVLAVVTDTRARLSRAASAMDVEQRRAELAEAQAKQHAAATDARRLVRLAVADAGSRADAEHADVADTVARQQVGIARAALAGAEARLRLDENEIAAHSLRAPSAGVVLRRQVTQGGYVAAGAPAFVLAPDGLRVVRAEVDEAFADGLRPGMPALISREFEDAGGVPARILRIGPSINAATLNDDGVSRSDMRVVNVVLALDDSRRFRIGQRVVVRVGP